MRWVYTHDSALARQALHVFGSWLAAVRASGLVDGSEWRWTPAMVRRWLARYKREGRDLHPWSVRRECWRLLTAAKEAFGSYKQALRACGYQKVLLRSDPKGVQPPGNVQWSEKRLRRLLRRLCQRHGPLSARIIRQDHLGAYLVLIKKWHSMSAVARHFKLPHRALLAPWTRERFTLELAERRRLGGSLRSLDMHREAPGLLAGGIELHGSWRKALETEGVEYRTVSGTYYRTGDEIGSELRDWCAKHGPLHHSRLRASNLALLTAATRRFDGLAKAAQDFGLPFQRGIGGRPLKRSAPGATVARKDNATPAPPL